MSKAPRPFALACLVAFALGGSAIGCKEKDKDDEKVAVTAAPAPTAPAAPPVAPTPAPTPPPAAPPPAAPASDVQRYPNERPLSGDAALVNEVEARKQTNHASELVAKLPKGTPVTKIALSGAWALVGWKMGPDSKQGWVEEIRAFGGQGRVPQPILDEGRRRGVLWPGK
jgi:hypothetical protein